jgi:hypothetical protein
LLHRTVCDNKILIFKPVHMNATETLITNFYTAFQNKDFRSMQDCYLPHASFSDAVFTNLGSLEVKAMWHMLSLGAKDLKLEFDSVYAGELKGSCNWTAEYTFSLTKRKVINRIHAEFEFSEGKILRHHDNFSFYRWARQAFGVRGWLLGWTPYMKKKVRSASAKRLIDFISQYQEYQVLI